MGANQRNNMPLAKRKAIVKVFHAKDLIRLAADKICQEHRLNANGNLHFMFGHEEGKFLLRVDMTNAIVPDDGTETNPS
jgi:hypothetical protein